MLKQVLLTVLVWMLFVTGCASGPRQRRSVGILDYYRSNLNFRYHVAKVNQGEGQHMKPKPIGIFTLKSN